LSASAAGSFALNPETVSTSSLNRVSSTTTTIPNPNMSRRQRSPIDSEASSSATTTTTSPITKPMKGAFRERAIRILQLFDPARLPQIDRLCRKFSDHMDGLVEFLEERYDLRPGTLQKMTKPLTEQFSGEYSQFQQEFQNINNNGSNGQYSATDVLSIRDRVLRLLKNYDPPRIVRMDIELKENEDRQEEYLSDLIQHYGHEPVGSELDIRYRVLKFYHYYNREKLGDVDSVLVKFKGRESQLMKMFLTKYGSEPPDPMPLPAPHFSRSEVRKKVAEIYKIYAPDKVPSVESILDRYQHDYDNLLDQLAVKYKLPRDPRLLKEIRERLEIIYSNAAPAKLGEIDSLLERYHGLEENLFDQLKIKYDITPEIEAKWRSAFMKEQQRRQDLRIQAAGGVLDADIKSKNIINDSPESTSIVPAPVENNKHSHLRSNLQAMHEALESQKKLQNGGITNNNDDEHDPEL
jgi:hypothetical protein